MTILLPENGFKSWRKKPSGILQLKNRGPWESYAIFNGYNEVDLIGNRNMSFSHSGRGVTPGGMGARFTSNSGQYIQLEPDSATGYKSSVVIVGTVDDTSGNHTLYTTDPYTFGGLEVRITAGVVEAFSTFIGSFASSGSVTVNANEVFAVGVVHQGFNKCALFLNGVKLDENSISSGGNYSDIVLARIDGDTTDEWDGVALAAMCRTRGPLLTDAEMISATANPYQYVKPAADIYYFKSTATATTTVGQASETDSVPAISASKSLAVGQASETDTASAVTAGITVSVGQASETDSVSTLAWTKALAVGQATETDTTFSVSYGIISSVGQASEADSVESLSWIKNLSVGQSSEADTALAITALKSASTGQAVETDSVNSVTWSKIATVGQASETDTAPSVTALGKLGLATETDTVIGITWTKALAVGQASETGVAQAVSVLKALSVGQAVETDTAPPLVQDIVVTVGLATELDSVPSLQGLAFAGEATIITSSRDRNIVYTNRDRTLTLRTR